MLILIILACLIFIFFIFDCIVNLIYVKQNILLKKVVNDLCLKYFELDRRGDCNER